MAGVPSNWRDCRCKPVVIPAEEMKRVALLFAVMLAMFVAAVHPAEAAYGSDVPGPVAVHVMHSDRESLSDHEGRGDQQGDDGIGHHHCPTCWIADSTPRIKQILIGITALLADHYSSLTSRSDDPLLEPPAA